MRVALVGVEEGVMIDFSMAWEIFVGAVFLLVVIGVAILVWDYIEEWREERGKNVWKLRYKWRRRR